MSRSVKSSNDDTELKIGCTHIRLSSTQSIMNSPLRRSSRIKQAKYSPVSSESDTSIASNNQSIKNTRKRTVTMDAETTKGRVRKLSISSDISETMSTDILEIPGRRTTRSSLAAATLIATPTKINTRAVSKRLIRAGSETKSPLPSVRITRRTRASSVDPESLPNQNKSQPCTPVKICKRASILPLESPVKEEVEKKDLVPYVQLNVTIAEIDEVISSGSSPNNSLGSQQNKKVNRNQNINKVKEDNYDIIASSLSKLDETCQLSKEKDEIVYKKESSIEGQCSSEENMLVDDTTIEVSIHDSFSNSSSSSNSKRENKSETIKKDLSTKSPTKELGIKTEHLLNTLVEEQKKYPSNKENQTLNIVTNESEKKSIQPSINITPLDIKSLTLIIVNKSLNEKEPISIKNEPNSDKCYSREVIEPTIKHNTLSKESTDNFEEIIDISANFSSPDVTSKKKNFGDSLLNDAKRQSLVHDADDKLATINDTNELILLQHDNVELMDTTIAKDEMSIENVNESNETAIEVTGKSYEIDKTECKQSDSNKTEFNDKNRTSYSPMKTTIEQKSNCEESSILITDNTKIKLVLEEQNLCRNENKISNVIQSKFDHSVNSLIDKKNPSLLNISCNNQFTVIDKRSTVIQDDTVNNTDFTEQRNVSKYIIESIPEVSNCTLQTSNSACNTDVDNIIIQNVQFSCKTETSKNFISSGEIDLKDVLLEDTSKLNVQRKSTDDTFNNLETKIENLQLEKSHKDKKSIQSMDNDFDVNTDISLFKDIPVDKCKKKIYKKKNDIETLEHSNLQLIEEIKNESETECDLVLVDKQAWLAAKNMKAAKQSESFEYDSDDTVLLKSRLDAALASCDVKQLDSIHKELLTDFDSEEDEIVKPVKVWKTLMKRRSESRKDKDSLTDLTEDDLITADKSLNKSAAVLNRNSNQSASELNTKSEQIAKAGKRLSVTHDELGEEIKNDVNGLTRNLQINKENTSLRKSTEEKKSLNKSSKDISLKQENNIMQNISLNKSQIDNSEEEPSTNASIGKKSQKKRYFLNKSHDKDINNDTTEFKETKNLSSKDNERNKNTPLSSLINKNSKLVNTKTSIYSNDDKSNDSEIVIPATDFRSKGYSTVAQVESIPDNSGTKITSIYLNNNKSSDNVIVIPVDFESKSCSTVAQVGSISDDSDTIPHFLFESVSSDDSTDDSTYSDIKTEYNLDGMKQMFSDDNVLADECRASESEFSDSDDNGSDLADFIINDDELEDEEEAKKQDNNKEKEEKYDEEDKQSMGKTSTEEMVDNKNKKNTNESDGTAKKEEVENEDKQLNVNIEQADIENKTRGNEDIQKKNDIANEKGKKSVKVKIDAISNIYNKLPKIYENKKDKFIECTSPCTSQTEAKRKVKIKKFNMKENETILLDTSNLCPSKKKKSYMKENEKITLEDKSNSISTKRRKKSDPCSSKDIAEQNSIEQLNESELTFTKKLQKSHIIMECSTPKLGTSKQKFEINTSETFGKISEFKDTKSNNMNKTMQNMLLEKNNSKKHSVLEDIDLREFNRTNKKEKNFKSFPTDLSSLIGKTSVISTSSKMIELHKTMDITYTETPTIRYLRKERLNESAPVSKLNTAIIPLRKKLLLAKEEKDIEQIAIKEKNDKEKVPDLVTLSNDAMEKHNQRKQKKRKKQMEETLCENIDEVLSQDTIKLNTKKKKCVKLSQSPIIKDNTCKDMCYVNKKEKKKKKQSITEQDESVNEDYILERNSHGKNMELVQHRKKYKGNMDILKWGSFTDNCMDNYVKKKDRYQENAKSKETLPQKLSKKKEEKTSLLQAVVSKLKSEKNLEFNRPQVENIISDTIKSKNTAFARARNEALEAIYTTEMHIKNNKELKKKEKGQYIKNKILKQDKILTKKKKVVKEINKSSDNLKRLPDDIIENLTDIPRKKQKKVIKEINKSSLSSGNQKRLSDDIIENLTDMSRKVKRQKLSRNGGQIMSSLSKDSTRSRLTAKNDGFTALSTSDSITQFTTVNLRKAKQPSKRSAAAAISFRQRMLVRNNREPVSAYMMYLEKHAASNKKF